MRTEESLPARAVPAVAPPDPSPLEQASDALLAERAGDGDVRAFAVLVRRCAPLLRAYAIRVLRSDADADDCVQEAFITAWDQLGDLHDPAAVRAWLARITTRKALDRVRARREHADLDDQEAIASAAAGPERRVEASSTANALSAALDELPEDQRQTWLLRELGGLGYAEIAEELRLPVSTVRGLLARARKQLVQRMEAWR